MSVQLYHHSLYKIKLFPTNTQQSRLVPPIVGYTLTPVYLLYCISPTTTFVELPNDIDPLCAYLFLDISTQKSYSSASMICHAHLPVIYLPEFPTTFQFIYHVTATKSQARSQTFLWGGSIWSNFGTFYDYAWIILRLR